jgi:hypothetical protein
MSAEPRQADLVLARLQESPGEWVSMPELARISGSMNIHSRIDQLRHQGGHHIENFMQRRPGSRRNDSFYRLILPQPEPANQA